MYYQDICALIPYYDKYGQNCTCVILRDKTRSYYHFPIKKFIKDMFYESHLDLNAIKNWSIKILGTKYNNPLILHKEVIFIPVKLRQSIGKGDGCYGYIHLNALADVQDYIIFLTNDMPIPTLSSKAYVLQKKAQGLLLKYTYPSHTECHLSVNSICAFYMAQS